MKEFKTTIGTLSIRFTEEERKVLEVISLIRNQSCSGFIKSLFYDWVKDNENFIKREAKRRKEFDNILKG